MIEAVLLFLGRLPLWLKVALGALGFFYLMLLYDKHIDDPRVAEDARRGFVVIAEKEAVEAELDLARRLLTAEQEAKKEFETEIARLHALQTAKDELDRIEDANYEAKLQAAGRSCPLTDDDIDWVQKS